MNPLEQREQSFFAKISAQPLRVSPAKFFGTINDAHRGSAGKSGNLWNDWKGPRLTLAAVAPTVRARLLRIDGIFRGASP